MLREAYERAVEQLRSDPHYPLPVPTQYELAAQVRRVTPGARLDEIVTEAFRLGLVLADVDLGQRAAGARSARVASTR